MLHFSTERRWAALIGVLIGAAACDSSVRGDSASSSTASGGAGGTGGTGDGGATNSVSNGFCCGSPGFWDTKCVDRAELWAEVLAGSAAVTTSGDSGAGGGGGGTAGSGGGATGGAGGSGAPTIPSGCPEPADAEPALGYPYTNIGDLVPGGSDQCCYEVYHPAQTGRPLFVDGKPTTAGVGRGATWSQGVVAIDVATLSRVARARFHDHWLEVARLEHASIASFAKFTLELLLLGAPMDLVRDAQQAGLDEVSHAERSFAIAATYGGVGSAPRPMPELANLRPGVGAAAIVRAAIEDGCVGETLGAFEAGEQAALACSSELSQTLSRIADDESRHAALAWRFVRWAVESGQVDACLVREVIASAVARHRAALGRPAAPGPEDAVAEQHGLLSPARRDALHRETLDRIEALAAMVFSGAAATTNRDQTVS
jgi:hypothetical protein